MSNNKQASLEELYTTGDLTLLKKSIAELTAKKKLQGTLTRYLDVIRMLVNSIPDP